MGFMKKLGKICCLGQKSGEFFSKSPYSPVIVKEILESWGHKHETHDV